MKVKPRHALAILISLGIIFTIYQPPGAAASPRYDSEPYPAIDDYIELRMQELKIPGAALAIVQDDQIVYLQGYGVADAAGRPVTAQTPFMLASVSKSFTALAIMQLVETRQLDLDAPVQQYLPWFQIADEKASAAMTIRQLLYQTSGFSETDGNRINLDSNMGEDAVTAAMKRLTDIRLIHAPGESFEYSNVNYGLLGAVVESVSGQSFGAYIQEHIFTPLDMRHSFASRSAADEAGATPGFFPFFGRPIAFGRFMTYSNAIAPWAGLYSSAEDLAHYLIAHLNEGRYLSNAILSPAGMSDLHQPGAEVNRWTGYAMGWWVDPNFDLASQGQAGRLSDFSIPVVISHQGSWSNFRTVALMLPEQKTGIVLLMNTNNAAADSAYGMIGWDVLLIHLGKQPMNYAPMEDFFRQNAALFMMGGLVLLTVSFIWFLRKMRGWHRHPEALRPHPQMILGLVVLPLVIDLLIAWYLLGVQLPAAKSTLMTVLRMFPDTGILLILVLLFTVVWGLIRTILTLRAVFRGKRTRHFSIQG